MPELIQFVIAELLVAILLVAGHRMFPDIPTWALLVIAFVLAFGVLPLTFSSWRAKVATAVRYAIMSARNLKWPNLLPGRQRRTMARREEMLGDFRRLEEALKRRKFDEHDTYTASIVGLVMQKYAALLSQVEDHPDARIGAAAFCVAALETYPNDLPKAMEIIEERMKHPFRVRLTGRGRIASVGLSAAENELLRPSS